MDHNRGVRRHRSQTGGAGPEDDDNDADPTESATGSVHARTLDGDIDDDETTVKPGEEKTLSTAELAMRDLLDHAPDIALSDVRSVGARPPLSPSAERLGASDDDMRDVSKALHDSHKPPTKVCIEKRLLVVFLAFVRCCCVLLRKRLIFFCRRMHCSRNLFSKRRSLP